MHWIEIPRRDNSWNRPYRSDCTCRRILPIKFPLSLGCLRCTVEYGLGIPRHGDVFVIIASLSASRSCFAESMNCLALTFLPALIFA